MENYVHPEPCVQYVELAGTVGLFVKLDTMLLDEISLENFFHSFQHQVRGSGRLVSNVTDPKLSTTDPDP